METNSPPQERLPFELLKLIIDNCIDNKVIHPRSDKATANAPGHMLCYRDDITGRSVAIDVREDSKKAKKECCRLLKVALVSKTTLGLVRAAVERAVKHEIEVLRAEALVEFKKFAGYLRGRERRFARAERRR